MQVKTFAPKEVIAHAGERSTSIGVVIDGAVLARNIDADGDTLLLDVNGRSEAFGADILWATGNITNYTVCALDYCQVLMVGMDKIVHAEGALCELRTRVVENLFSVMTEKNRKMEEHLRLVALKSLRSRLELFLKAQHSSLTLRCLRCPLVVEMADHLHAIAALSRELSRMKAEGLIDYHATALDCCGFIP